MPIQFRCPACDRLLGIARRKAGTVVACPRCGVEVRVPLLAGVAVEPAGAANGDVPVIQPLPPVKSKKPKAAKPPAELEALPLFERPDFESLLNPAVKQAKAAKPTKPEPPAAAPAPVEPPPREKPWAEVVAEADGVDVVPAMVVTRKNLTFVAVLIAVLIGLAFAAGYFLAALTVAPAKKAGATSAITSPAGFGG